LKFLRKIWMKIPQVDGNARRTALKKSLFAIPALSLVFNEARAGNRDSGAVKQPLAQQEADFGDKTHSELLREDLRKQDGLKYIGQALSVEDLKKVIPQLPGQRISLASWHRQGWGGLSHPVGGGILYSVHNKELKEDGGTIFRVNDEWCWVRDISEKIDAQWFGVTGDGIAREDNISSAIDYITNNGGVLSFPKGKINFGLLRKRIEYFEGIKRFTICGQGYATVFTFENIEPPERHSNKNWVSEAPLLLLKGKGTEQFIDSPVIENLTIDYSLQRNGGGTNLNNLEECHPSPHSTGTIGIYAIYCLNPVFRNLRISHIYGSGIYCKKSFNPQSHNIYFYNVSANQIIDRTNRMDRDSSGGAIFYWSCFGGKIADCVAWNTRKYTVDYKSPDNGQQLKDTLCGYIGFWSEFSVSRTDRPDAAPPMINWLNVKKKDLDRVSRGVEISNSIVYGYVIGIKGEAAVDISIINNKVLNCYLPITCSGVRGVIQRNFTDMLGCEDVKCPQGGLEQKRSHLGGMTFTPKSTFNQSLEISHNYVRTRNYPAFTTSRINLKFIYNYVNIYGYAPIFKTVSQGDFYGLEVIGNNFVIEEGAEMSDSVLSSNETSIFHSNTFDVKTDNAPKLIFLPTKSGWSHISFEGNYFNGPVILQFNLKSSVQKNHFLMPKNYNNGVISLHGDGSKLMDNHFLLNSRQAPKSLFVSAAHVTIADNEVQINDNGSAETHGVFWFDQRAVAPKLYGNCLKNNQVNFSLVVADTLTMPFLENNSSDGKGSLLWITKSLKGPILPQVNFFKGGFIDGKRDLQEPNLPNNLWEEYSPTPGQRLPYLSPNPGGREGILMTMDGWREFGSVAN